jgi:hypothetical protein
MVSRDTPIGDRAHGTLKEPPRDRPEISTPDTLCQRLAELQLINALLAVDLLVKAAARPVSAARSCSRRCR